MNWGYSRVLLNKQNLIDKNYPAYIKDGNKIVVCLNMIENKVELK